MISRDATLDRRPRRHARLARHTSGLHGFGGTFTATGGGTVFWEARPVGYFDDVTLEGDPA